MKFFIYSLFTFQINFFLYAVTGKAFRHELKRLFRSIAVRLHLTHDNEPTPLDRRLLGNCTNYQMSDSALGQRRISPASAQMMRCRASIDSCTSNGNSVKRRF